MDKSLIDRTIDEKADEFVRKYAEQYTEKPGPSIFGAYQKELEQTPTEFQQKYLAQHQPKYKVPPHLLVDTGAMLGQSTEVPSSRKDLPEAPPVKEATISEALSTIVPFGEIAQGYGQTPGNILLEAASWLPAGKIAKPAVSGIGKAASKVAPEVAKYLKEGAMTLGENVPKILESQRGSFSTKKIAEGWSPEKIKKIAKGLTEESAEAMEKAYLAEDKIIREGFLSKKMPEEEAFKRIGLNQRRREVVEEWKKMDMGRGGPEIRYTYDPKSETAFALDASNKKVGEMAANKKGLGHEVLLSVVDDPLQGLGIGKELSTILKRYLGPYAGAGTAMTPVGKEFRKAVQMPSISSRFGTNMSNLIIADKQAMYESAVRLAKQTGKSVDEIYNAMLNNYGIPL